jgi:hypothetical protein
MPPSSIALIDTGKASAFSMTQSTVFKETMMKKNHCQKHVLLATFCLLVGQ